MNLNISGRFLQTPVKDKEFRSLGAGSKTFRVTKATKKTVVLTDISNENFTLTVTIDEKNEDNIFSE